MKKGISTWSILQPELRILTDGRESGRARNLFPERLRILNESLWNSLRSVHARFFISSVLNSRIVCPKRRKTDFQSEHHPAGIAKWPCTRLPKSTRTWSTAENIFEKHLLLCSGSTTSLLHQHRCLISGWSLIRLQDMAKFRRIAVVASQAHSFRF